MQQAGWGRAARGRRQVLEDGQVGASEVARVGQAGVLVASREKAATEAYEKRRRGRCCGRVWQAGAGPSWCSSGVCHWWSLSMQLQKSIAPLMGEIGPRLGGLHWKESIGLPRGGAEG